MYREHMLCIERSKCSSIDKSSQTTDIASYVPPTHSSLHRATLAAPHRRQANLRRPDTKILLSLREVVRETDRRRVTLLDYLQQVYPLEWQHFVKDTKILAEDSATMFGGSCSVRGSGSPFGASDDKGGRREFETDIPLYHWIQERHIRVRTSSTYRGISSSVDTMPHRLWFHQLREGHQAPILHGESGDVGCFLQQCGTPRTQAGEDGEAQDQIRSVEATVLPVQQGT